MIKSAALAYDAPEELLAFTLAMAEGRRTQYLRAGAARLLGVADFFATAERYAAEVDPKWQPGPELEWLREEARLCFVAYAVGLMLATW